MNFTSELLEAAGKLLNLVAQLLRVDQRIAPHRLELGALLLDSTLHGLNDLWGPHVIEAVVCCRVDQPQ